MDGSVKKLPNGRYQARYRDTTKRQHAKSFALRRDADTWLKAELAALASDRYVNPRTRRLTVGEWCEQWLETYRKTRRASSANQAEVHIRRIVAALGDRPLGDVRPHDIESWMGDLRVEGLAVSYRQALHRRLSTIYTAAIRSDLVVRSPLSRHTSPSSEDGKRDVFICSDEQLDALHDALPEGMRSAVLLAAYAGLRVAEIAALRPSDIDFFRKMIRPAIQWPGETLKTAASRTPIPIPDELVSELSAAIARWDAPTVVVGTFGRPVTPYRIEEAWRKARVTVPGLPDGYRIHDLRHYFASMLIGSGLDIQRVSSAMRHASPAVTLGVYSHLMPGRDDETRDAIRGAMQRRSRATVAAPISIESARR